MLIIHRKSKWRYFWWGVWAIDLSGLVFVLLLTMGVSCVERVFIDAIYGAIDLLSTLGVLYKQV